MPTPPGGQRVRMSDHAAALQDLGELEQRTYAALAAVEARGEAPYADQVAHEAELSPEETREALRALSGRSLVAELDGADDPDLGPRSTVEDRG